MDAFFSDVQKPVLCQPMDADRVNGNHFFANGGDGGNSFTKATAHEGVKIA
jgi:hypothetical protein